MRADQTSLLESVCPACHYSLAAQFFFGEAQPLSTLGWPSSPEQAKANDVPVQDDGDCKNKVLSRSAKSMKVEFKCPDTQGTATVNFMSPTQYETKIDATTSEGGQQRKVQQTLKSKWVKASCGG